MRKMNLIQRLEEFASTTPDACWEWEGWLGTGGYGYTNVGNGRRNGRRVKVHRYSYEYFNGPIPGGAVVDHLCRNRRCMNPRHLEAVSPRENVLRGDGVAAQNARKTHCKRGHEFTAENTYTIRLKSGETERSCKRCAAERYQQRRASGWRQIKSQAPRV